MTALRKNKQTTHEIELTGQLALLDLTGAMYLPAHDALLVADLHFEKGSSFARRGMMLPPYDTRETLVALSDAVFRFNPKTVIALGDSFHDIGGPERLGDEERTTLCRACSRAATGSGSRATTTASCPTASAGRWWRRWRSALSPCATSRWRASRRRSPAICIRSARW